MEQQRSAPNAIETLTPDSIHSGILKDGSYARFVARHTSKPSKRLGLGIIKHDLNRIET